MSACKRLDCSYNELTKLPNLPECINLDCNNNKLTELPNLLKCKILDCSYNLLEKLPEKPIFEKLICHNNPELYYTQEFARKFNVSYPSPKEEKEILFKKRISHITFLLNTTYAKYDPKKIVFKYVNVEK